VSLDKAKGFFKEKGPQALTKARGHVTNLPEYNPSMSIVYVLGAGASYGERFTPLDTKYPHSTVTPPITTGFFSQDLIGALKQDPNAIGEEFKELLTWITGTCLAPRNQHFGEGEWKSLNIEDVFTRLEICREFENPAGRTGASLLVIRNQLLDYIRRIIGLCTRNAFGAYSHMLVDNLRPDDSVLTFNWDLLLDDSFVSTSHRLPHYNNFLARMGAMDNQYFIPHWTPGSGLFLKLHGSLNWFQCTNSICAEAEKVIFRNDTSSCLDWSLGTEYYPCRRCGSDAAPLIIPPVLRKPITAQETVRAVWGLAGKIIQQADVIVIIGFSAAPTDFYASWLLSTVFLDPVGLRETLLKRKSVIVANPLNDADQREAKDFKQRMLKLFPHSYNANFRTFSEIQEICHQARAFDHSEEIERNPPTQASNT
jgi:hypothetical protein